MAISLITQGQDYDALVSLIIIIYFVLLNHLNYVLRHFLFNFIEIVCVGFCCDVLSVDLFSSSNFFGH